MLIVNRLQEIMGTIHRDLVKDNIILHEGEFWKVTHVINTTAFIVKVGNTSEPYSKHELAHLTQSGLIFPYEIITNPVEDLIKGSK